KNGTFSGRDGKYTIDVDKNGILEFEYVGFRNTTLETAGKTNFDVVLLEDLYALDEVVVVGYGTQKKINLTGAVDQISGDDIAFKNTPNVLSSLQGEMSG